MTIVLSGLFYLTCFSQKYQRHQREFERENFQRVTASNGEAYPHIKFVLKQFAVTPNALSSVSHIIASIAHLCILVRKRKKYDREVTDKQEYFN